MSGRPGSGTSLALAVLTAGLLAAPRLSAVDVRINEFLASNSATAPAGSGEAVDEDGDSSDWIEIWNPTGDPINLGGWSLTDDPLQPRRWTFPEVELGPGAYLLVFASGKDRAAAGQELHTDFQIDRAAGGHLALHRPAAGGGTDVVSAYEAYPSQKPDVSFGMFGTETDPVVGYFLAPTPGTANAAAPISGFVADTKFDLGRGIYDAPITVNVSCDTPGATIVYTTDGTIPSDTNGTKAPAPDASTPPAVAVPIATTTVLRVIATKPGFQPTNVDTQTYIFPAAVLQQSGAGFGGVNWGHAGPDWEMDPDIVNHLNPEVRPVADDLKKLPTLSIGMPFSTMWGSGGIYIAGENIERDCSIELFNPDGSISAPNAAGGTQTDGTIQIVGGSSTGRWKSDKLSLRLRFTDGDLNYPVFGPDAAASFDTLVIDARLNNVWHYGGGSGADGQRNRAQYTRDQYVADLQQALGGHSPHGRHVHVYIAGVYWGIHTLHERPDDNFAADYLGGDNDDYDVMKHRSTTVVNGSSANYTKLHQLADQDLTQPENYRAVVDMLDIDHFINYMLVNYFVGNTDWAHQNWYASYNRVDPAGRWRFHSWDAEHSMESVTHNVVTKNDAGGPTNLQNDLMRNPDYKVRFADLAYRAFFKSGPLTPERAASIYQHRARPIEEAIRIESARWGDNQRSTPYTRLDWLNNRSDLLSNYFPRRTDIVVGQLRTRGWYPATQPPQLGQDGGRVPAGFQLTMTSPSGGTIYYTTNGTDPRSPATSTAEAVVLVGESAPKRALMPADGSLDAIWMAPSFDDSAWPSGTMGGGYENSLAGGYTDLIDPAFDIGAQANAASQETIYMRMPFMLSGADQVATLTLRVRYDDGFVAYLNGTRIHSVNAPASPAWNSGATTSHSDTEAVEFVSFDVTASRDLLQDGANLLAVHGLNQGAGGSDFLIWATLEATMGDGTPDGPSAAASAYTTPLTLSEPLTLKARVLNGSEWSPLVESEFIVDADPAGAGNIVVSEIHYRPASPTPDEIAAGHDDRSDFEFLELHNIGVRAADFTGVVFTAGIEFDFANAATRYLPPGGYFLIVEDRAAFEARYGTGLPVVGEFANGTQLSNTGETIALVNPALPAAEQTIKSFLFDDQLPWPTEADGTGNSLVLARPALNEDHALPASWRASTLIGGSPGAADPDSGSGIDSWVIANGLAGSSPGDDPNGDGSPLLLDYALVGVPGAGSTAALSVAAINSADGSVSLTYPRNPAATDVTFAFEESADLAAWTPVAATETGTAPGPMGTEIVTVEFGPPAAEGEAHRFVRLVVRIAP